MFLGDHQHTLDAKGRVSLPAKFRGEMTGRIVIAKGFEGCLYVYPADTYAGFVRRLMGTDDFNPKFRKVRRFFTSGAVETESDKAGRITLPPGLREYAGLTKDVAITGNGDRIEIWDLEKWAEYNGDTADSIEHDAEEMLSLGFL
ncbi:MAG: division/cell wall cluster transcriptional repressor MraZ [Clostridiales bacterium]|nr:division/cell wall cluster transcriptional repressor MraZ [Clostridiales bacterium]